MNGQQEAREAPALGGYGSEAPPTVSEVPILAPSASPFHSHHYPPNASEGQEILGVRLLKLLASPFASLTRSSQTLLRLDFRRPLSFPKRPSRPSPPPPRSSSPFGPLHGSRTRLQLMQTWDLPPKCEKEATEGGPREIPWLKLGIGGSVEMDDDGGVLVPKARLKTKYAILHVMPSPCFEIRMKFPVGISSLAASIRCSGVSWAQQRGGWLAKEYKGGGQEVVVLFAFTEESQMCEKPSITIYVARVRGGDAGVGANEGVSLSALFMCFSLLHWQQVYGALVHGSTSTHC
ncbi:hypothetical protein EJ110_NYTH56124 [Nymphaea thermarum]|nr:hypothetical protein EJ110_NYTH56124 [Nymphaea thermarum]